MPEGPEIKRAADQIARALVDHPITEIFFAFERLKPFEPVLQGTAVTSVQARGKALLILFNNQLSLYSHNQLYGRWFIRRPHSYPNTQRQLRVAIHTTKQSALLYSASDIEVLDATGVQTHPFLSKLGLDVLSEEVTAAQVATRLLHPSFRRRGLTSLLLHQDCLCGLGNYLRSEILFVTRLHPSLRPRDCTEEQIARLAAAAIDLPRQSYQHQGITTNLQLAQQLKAEGKKRGHYRHWVFNRQGQSCFVCGQAIVKEILAGRRLYYCPNCQPLPPARSTR